MDADASSSSPHPMDPQFRLPAMGPEAQGTQSKGPPLLPPPRVSASAWISPLSAIPGGDYGSGRVPFYSEYAPSQLRHFRSLRSSPSAAPPGPPTIATAWETPPNATTGLEPWSPGPLPKAAAPPPGFAAAPQVAAPNPLPKAAVANKSPPPLPKQAAASQSQVPKAPWRFSRAPQCSEQLSVLQRTCR